MFKSYNHPKVLKGKIAPEEMFQIFAESFDILHSIYNKTKSTVYVDYDITAEEFISYYKYVSMFYEKDNEFEDSVLSVWETPKKNYPKENRYEEEDREDYKDNYKGDNYKEDYQDSYKGDNYQDNHKEDYQDNYNDNYKDSYYDQRSQNSYNENRKNNYDYDNPKDTYRGGKPKDTYRGGKPKEERNDYPQRKEKNLRNDLRKNPYLEEEPKDNYGYNPRENKSILPPDIMNKLKQILKERGVKGILQIKRSLLLNSQNELNAIPLNELLVTLQDYRFDLTKFDMDQILNYYPTEFDPIDVNKLMDDLFMDEYPTNTSVMRKAFMKIAGRNDTVNVQAIKRAFNPYKHPDYTKGRNTAEKILTEFMDLFDYHFFLLNNGVGKNQSISYKEFAEFMNLFALSLEKEEFEEAVKGVFEIY